ncbi:Uncharacterised protein [Mycobacteroides abscessus subsp. abscessus]|uniref:hypothetical protein n=1 Tax=Mycobacteroides abscessus TaxID=36809 RepID=UPI0009A80DAD|nr:hypothetical protein [Mycobacteroides abscessus]SLI19259.1 Uncharacterised protein [Mycobacteroides abscessus subsp. abscessus]
MDAHDEYEKRLHAMGVGGDKASAIRAVGRQLEIEHALRTGRGGQPTPTFVGEQSSPPSVTQSRAGSSASDDSGLVLVDELSSDEVAAALDGEIPEPGGEVVVVEGYRNPLQPAEHQVFTGEPTDLRRMATLEQVASLPDGTVVIWNDDHDDRQAGVLETEDRRGRVVRPISIGRYEDDWYLGAVRPPVWVVTFDDPPEAHEA